MVVLSSGILMHATLIVLIGKEYYEGPRQCCDVGLLGGKTKVGILRSGPSP